MPAAAPPRQSSATAPAPVTRPAASPRLSRGPPSPPRLRPRWPGPSWSSWAAVTRAPARCTPVGPRVPQVRRRTGPPRPHRPTVAASERALTTSAGLEVNPLADLFEHAVHVDPSRPMLTFYDDSTGERVELSGATASN